MLGEIFRSFKKSSTIKKLTKEYIDYQNKSYSSALGMIDSMTSDKKNKILDKIVELSLNEPNNQQPINKFNITKTKLIKTIEELEDLGCIIFAKGHYVPISAILYPQTLEYIFYKERSNKEDKEKMVKDLISYFDGNKMGNIVEIDYE